MLHAPTNDRNTKAEASSRTMKNLSEWEQPTYPGGMESHQSLLHQRQANLATLQKTYGNQTVLRMMGQYQKAISLTQTKLTMSQPGDGYEQEADRIADQVTRMPESAVERQIAPQEEEKQEEEEGSIQTKPTAHSISSRDQAAPVPSIVHEVLRSPGHPLDSDTRCFMEPRFGYGFSRVRLHSDSKAAESAQSINALAYTVGHDIVFAAGQYMPHFTKGQQLLAHELTHVLQQQGQQFQMLERSQKIASPIQTKLTVSQPGDKYGQEAERIADRVMRMTEPRIQRVFPECEEEPQHTGIEGEEPRWAEPRPRFFGCRRMGPLPYRESAELAERTMPPPTPAESMARELRSLQSGNGWHMRLPRSDIAGPIEIQPGQPRTRTDPGTPPTFTSGYPRQPSLVPISSNSVLSDARDLLLAQIRRELNNLEIPTQYRRTIEAGDQTVERSALPVHFRSDRGFVYRTSTWAEQGEYTRFVGAHHPAAERHEQFERSATLQTIGYDNPSPRIEGFWSIFHWVLGHEGDTPAINAWDDQMVTIGPGFSAHARRAGAVYRRMPQEFHQQLYRYGIYVEEDNSFTVLDLRRGVVETGDRALRLLQTDERRLGMLIRAAMARYEVGPRGNRRSQRAWMMRAQFEQFMERNRQVPPAVLRWHPRGRVIFPFILMHWAGCLNWRSIASRGPSPTNIANYALERIQQVRPQWRRETIIMRINDLARDAGVGQVLR